MCISGFCLFWSSASVFCLLCLDFAGFCISHALLCGYLGYVFLTRLHGVWGWYKADFLRNLAILGFSALGGFLGLLILVF